MFDAIVVGLGGMGSATLYHLARRGLQVLGLEQFSIPHVFGSSHGLTRIIRLAYFESPTYVPLLRRSYELWNHLQAEADEPLLHITRSIEAGWDGTDYEQALRGAESLLNETKTGGPRKIVLISDFHTAGWNPATASFKLGNATELQTIDVGGNNSDPNVAVTNVEAILQAVPLD